MLMPLLLVWGPHLRSAALPLCLVVPFWREGKGW